MRYCLIVSGHLWLMHLLHVLSIRLCNVAFDICISLTFKTVDFARITVVVGKYVIVVVGIHT